MTPFAHPIVLSLARILLPVALIALGLLCAAEAETPKQIQAGKWPPEVTQALDRAGTNRPQLLAALQRTPTGRRAGMVFLIANMPDRDLRTLSATFLLDQVSLAYQAFTKAPWKAQVPQSIFLNDILPYACLNEARDGSRAKLRSISIPLIADAATPGQAAQALNAKLFPLLRVVYSTERNRPDQAPTETIATGKASCSGLSILLADACRSVGIPARLVGTPLWTDGSGNHTWVEIWDGGWHFVGAAEPDAQGLDHAWFEHNASLAKRDVPQNAIYASSFARTGVSFPLIWDPEVDWVPAVNVTDRYAAKIPAEDASTTRLLVRVLDAAGKRVAADVTVRDIADGSKTWNGTGPGETADTNNLAAFDLPRGQVYEITASPKFIGTLEHNRAAQTASTSSTAPLPSQEVRQTFAPGSVIQTTATLQFAPPPSQRHLTASDQTALQDAAADYFAAPPDKKATWTYSTNLDALLLKNETDARRIVWDAFRNAPTHAAMRKDFGADQVTFGQYLSPYTIRTIGTRPTNGWPLVIAMHGGGGVPKEVNDSQWQIMQTYYEDHPEAAGGGYKYLALRAPNDTWNGFYDVYVYPLIANLVTQFRLFGDIDPNKVFLMGYSHGGYGAYAIGPKEPDLFAAIHGAAAAPTDGETTAKTLRTTEFTGVVGENDTMYGRLDRDRRFAAEIDALRGERHDIYPVSIQVMSGYDHPNLPDRERLADILPAVRDAAPREVTWLMTDDVIQDLFWLHTDAPGKTQEIDASCRDNTVTVATTATVSATTVYLDSRLVDFAKPITLVVNGKSVTQPLHPSLRTLCETMARRGDPDLAFTAAVSASMPH